MAVGAETQPITGSETGSAFADGNVKPHVMKVSGTAGCWYWGLSSAPEFIADGTGIFPVLDDIGFLKLFYTQAAVDKILALYA